MQSITITDKESGQRFDKFLQKYFAGATKSFLYKMLRKKNITLNKKKAEGNEILKAGDTVESFFSAETYEKMRHVEGAGKVLTKKYEEAYAGIRGIRVLYEDEDILALDKPAGVFSQESDEGELSANEWMVGYLLKSGKLTEEDLNLFRPGVQNRLDRNTSGILLCGKSLKGAQELSRLLKERNLTKEYRSICKGVLKADIDLTGYLLKDEKSNKVTLSRKEVPGADPVHTTVHPLEQNGHVTVLSIDLHTGKPHQIRAHLSSIGHPLLGDSKYGDPGTNQKYKELGLKYQLLHAYRIAFPADASEKVPSLNGLEIRCPLPALYQKIYEREFHS
jgi:23S rRNA pseudouridine955/2504/2580 synthase